MPRARRRSESTLLRSSTLCVLAVSLLACREKPAEVRRAPEQGPARPSAEPARVRRPAPSGAFDCRELRAAPKTEGGVSAEIIELRPPGAGKKVYFLKTGELVMFEREAFLQAARCMRLEKAIRFLEEETGGEEESPVMDAFQLSFVAAALLDAGRAGVRLDDESAWRKSIVREGWAADGCAGHCRSFGRLYRLTEGDPNFFLRVTDNPS